MVQNFQFRFLVTMPSPPTRRRSCRTPTKKLYVGVDTVQSVTAPTGTVHMVNVGGQDVDTIWVSVLLFVYVSKVKTMLTLASGKDVNPSSAPTGVSVAVGAA